ncbi:ABC transporter permease [Paenarthrobacter sp. RAF9]
MTEKDQAQSDQTPAESTAEVRAADVSLDTAGGMLEPSIVPVSSQSGDSGHQQGSVLRRIVMGNGFVSVLAVIVALFLGGLLIASTDSQVAKTAGYLFARPTDFLSALWAAMTESYGALFQGSVFSPREGFKPILETMTVATPLIVTIMLNYVALFLLDFLLNTAAFRRPGDNSPISPRLDESATYPVLIPGSRLHLGFLVAVALTYGVWWLLNRSTIGFEFRAVGANPIAARTAGVKVSRATILVMAMAGALAAFGGVAQVAGTEKVLTGGVAAQIGFDSITVALLGRSTPWGTFFAGLLFGAFRAGAVQMQIQTGTPIDIVLVVQSLIVLFIAAPPLIRSIFRLEAKKKTKTPKAAPKAALANATGGAK